MRSRIIRVVESNGTDHLKPVGNKFVSVAEMPINAELFYFIIRRGRC